MTWTRIARTGAVALSTHKGEVAWDSGAILVITEGEGQLERGTGRRRLELTPRCRLAVLQTEQDLCPMMTGIGEGERLILEADV